MGKTSKPTHIQMSESLYECNKEQWEEMRAQGHSIEIIERCMEGPMPDLLIAPFAMRMTTDMLQQLPAALRLAIQGARALRYAPHGVTLKKGTKGVKTTKPHKGRNAKVKTEAPLPGQLSFVTGESTAQGSDHGDAGGSLHTVSNTTNDEGTHETHSK